MPTPPSARPTDDRSADAAPERAARPANRTGDDAAQSAERAAGEDARPELAEVSRLRERVDELEAELERKDEQLDAVVRQYESLLQDHPDGDAGDVTWRLGGERWQGNCDLEFAGRRDGKGGPDSLERGGTGEEERSATGVLKSLLR